MNNEITIPEGRFAFTRVSCKAIGFLIGRFVNVDITCFGPRHFNGDGFNKF